MDGLVSENHPLLTATKRVFERNRPRNRNNKSTYGTIPIGPDGTLPMRVSPELMSRALHIVRLIISGSQHRGWQIRPTKGDAPAAIVVDSQPVAFCLSEQVKGTRLPTSKGQEWGYPKFRYDITGKLRLELLDYVPQGAQRRWCEGRVRRLEPLIDEFLDAAFTTAEFLRERNRQRQIERQREERRIRRRGFELTRERDIRAHLNAWHEASSIRKFIGEVRRRGIRKSSWPAKELAAWISWAEAFAEKLDPFTNGQFDRALKDFSRLDAEFETEPE